MKKISLHCILVTAWLFGYATTLIAVPKFNPKFRWKHTGITVAENNEEKEKKEQEETNKKVEETNEIIETLEASIQIDDIIEPPASYRYSSFAKRDPFSYPAREELLDDEFIVSKLQYYAISLLKLVGVWRLSNGISKALILTPSGEGVVAVIGDPVGQNNGEIMEIGKNKIIVREYVMTPDGTRQFNDIDMFLLDYFEKDISTAGISFESMQPQETSLDEELSKIDNNANTPPVDAASSEPSTPASGNVPPMTDSATAPTNSNTSAQP